MTEAKNIDQKKKSPLHYARTALTKIFVSMVALTILFTSPKAYQYEFPQDVLSWIGLLLISVCIVGRTFSYLFICGRKNFQLIAGGPFSVVRNPLYVFSFIGLLGIVMILSSAVYAALLIVAFFGYYSLVIGGEETYLEDRYGDEYRAYKKAVPRWIPKMSLYKAPEMVEVQPSLVLKTMMDAFCFILALPILQLIEWAQKTGYLPVLWTLP